MAKNTGKVREFCQFGKVGTLPLLPEKKMIKVALSLYPVDAVIFILVVLKTAMRRYTEFEKIDHKNLHRNITNQ